MQIEQAVLEVQIGDKIMYNKFESIMWKDGTPFIKTIGGKIMPVKWNTKFGAFEVQRNPWDDIADVWLSNEKELKKMKECEIIEEMKKRWDKSAEKEQTGDSMGTISIISSIGWYEPVKEQEKNMFYPIKTITKVIFNDPATIVFWADGTKTVVQAYNEPFDKEKGLAMAIAKKALGNKGNYNEVFKKWICDDK